MKRDLRNKRILITGASSGIGRTLAEQLGSEGSKLVLTARSEDKLAELCRSLAARNVQAVPVRADVTVPADRQRMLDAAVSRFGGVDVLVNNAGIASWAHFAVSTEAVMRQVMEVNFFAPAELIRLAIPLLIQGEQPAILNVGSMCGRRAMPAWSEYSASKYALSGLTECLRGELARFDIDILLVQPGLTRSELQKNMLLSAGRMEIDYSKAMPAERVAAEIVRSLKNNITENVIGTDARWMLRFSRFFPRLLDRLIARRVTKLYAETATRVSNPATG